MDDRLRENQDGEYQGASKEYSGGHSATFASTRQAHRARLSRYHAKLLVELEILSNGPTYKGVSGPRVAPRSTLVRSSQ